MTLEDDRRPATRPSVGGRYVTGVDEARVSSLRRGAMNGLPSLSDKLADEPFGGRWGVVARVGEGATSIVWRAASPDGEVVALKVAKALAGAAEALAREARLLARAQR